MHDDEQLEQPDRYVPGALPNLREKRGEIVEEQEPQQGPPRSAGPKLTEQLRKEQEELREKRRENYRERYARKRREALDELKDEPAVMDDFSADEPIMGTLEAVAFFVMVGSGLAVSVWLTLELVRQILG